MCHDWDWHGHGMYGFMPRGRRPRYFTKEDVIRHLEEYQKDLEEELAEVVGRIERLKKEGQAEKTTPTAA